LPATETWGASLDFLTARNEEPAMRNLIIDGAAGGETKRRHDVTFPLLTLHRGKDRVYFSTGFFQKENIVYAGVLQIFRTKNQ
jgi:hypothetical protein